MRPRSDDTSRPGDTSCPGDPSRPGHTSRAIDTYLSRAGSDRRPQLVSHYGTRSDPSGISGINSDLSP
jgi:hypothetical protein